MTHYQGKTFRKNLQDTPNAYQSNFKQLEKDFIEKMTISQNIFHRIKHYVSELEILVSGVIKVYCGNNFSEKGRIDFLLQSIQTELGDFEERITSSRVIEQYDLYLEDPKKILITDPQLSDSLISSTFSDRGTIMAIKNEVKDLISDYRDAVGKLKEENATIKALVAERNREFEEYSPPPSTQKKKSEKHSRKETKVEEESDAESKIGEDKKVSKYAELNKFIDDLNRKKEENMKRLSTIETRLSIIKQTIPDEEVGILKASDLNREEDRPSENIYSKRHGLEVDTQTRTRAANKINDGEKDYIQYLKKISQGSTSKRLAKEDERRYESKAQSKNKEYIESSKRNRSRNEPQVLETEIEDLNREIATIKNLIDSAMIQRKYQSK